VIDRETSKHALKKECRRYSNTRVCYNKPIKRIYSDTYAWDEYIRCTFATIDIDNKYMILYPIDYLQYIHWMLIQAKKDKRVKGLWKDVN
jgi:hypothetical protein